MYELELAAPAESGHDCMLMLYSYKHLPIVVAIPRTCTNQIDVNVTLVVVHVVVRTAVSTVCADLVIENHVTIIACPNARSFPWLHVEGRGQ